MKTNKLLMLVAVAIVSVFTLMSCQSREERVISRIESLCDEIDDDDFDSDDIERIVEEFQELREDAQDCNFTSEQQKRLIKATGKVSAAMAKKMPGLLLKSGGSLLKNAMDFAGGFADGFAEGVGDDLDEAMEDLDDAMDDLDEAMDEMNEEFE